MNLLQTSIQKTIFILLLTSCFTSFGVLAKDSLEITNGWVRLTPPIAKNSAAYFVIQNISDKDITIVNVTTPTAESAAMHATEIERSMVRMVPLKQLLIQPGQKIEFVPGGKHLMLINLTEKLALNKEVLVAFKTDAGNTVVAKLIVSKGGNSQTHDHHQH